MTIKQLKEQIENFPDDLIVCIEKDTIAQEKFGVVCETKAIEVNELECSQIWVENKNRLLRVHAYLKDCVILK